VAYQLQLPPSWKIHPVFHTSLLSPYSETPLHGPNFSQPPPDLIDGEAEYEVELIRSHRRHGPASAIANADADAAKPAIVDAHEPGGVPYLRQFRTRMFQWSCMGGDDHDTSAWPMCRKSDHLKEQGKREFKGIV